MAKVLVGLVQRLLRRDDTQLKLLLLCTVIATVGFAFPRLVWATYIGYSLIALLLTQVMVGSSNAPNWSDALYRGLGLMAVVTMWLWLLTPLELIYSGMPLALSWSVLVGWSVIRLVTRFACTKRVTEALLMGATAGCLHIGLAAGLVMSALETIHPGSFQPLKWPASAIRAFWPAPAFFRQSTITPSSASPPSALVTLARCSPCHGW